MQMNSQAENQNVTQPTFNQKSDVAFLMEELDKLKTPDKPYHVKDWDFSTSQNIGTRQKHELKFESVPTEYVTGIQDALYRIYHHAKRTEDSPLTLVVMVHLRIGLLHIAHFLNSTSWGELESPARWGSFLRKVKVRKFKVGVINHIVRALNRLINCQEIKVYIDTKTLKKCAAQSMTKQAVALPPKLYQSMLSYALSVVEKYHKYRHEISRITGEVIKIAELVDNGEIIDFFYEKKEPSMTRWAKYERRIKAIEAITNDIPDFNATYRGTDLYKIEACCALVVQAFSGVRIGELGSFKKDSIKSKVIDGNEVVLLQGETTKGNNSKPKTETWQSHPIAKIALELASDMLESTRSKHLVDVARKEKEGMKPSKIKLMKNQLGSAFIKPSFIDPSSNNYTFKFEYQLKKVLTQWLNWEATQKDVEEFDTLNPTREGDLKVGGSYECLSSHDLRRTFAVFFVRYGFGTALGIKFQFKHQNINMSNYYANNAALARINDLLLDIDLEKELKDAQIDMGVDLFDEVFNKSTQLSGVKGEEIKQERIRRLKKGESIILTRHEIEGHLRAGDFHIIQLPSGAYCTNSSCDRVCGSQPFRAEIKECEHKLVTDKGAKKIAKQRERLIVKFKELNNGDKLKSLILSGLKQKIQIEEVTLKKHKISFTPFNDDIALN